MALKTFAAIHVGSGEVYLKIFELSRKNGLHVIDYARYYIELGSDTFTQGYIGHDLVYELCTVLKGFKAKMDEYAIVDYTAYAGSAVREARNRDLILDQIRIRTGLIVTCVDNAEQSFLMLKAAAGSISSFEKLIQEGVVIVDMGAGSLQVTVYDAGRLIFTHAFKLGALRIRELLSDLEGQSSDFNLVMNDYVGNEFDTFSSMVHETAKTRHLIAIGEEVYPMLSITRTEGESGNFKPEKLSQYYDKIKGLGFDEIAEKYSIPFEAATLIKPEMAVYGSLLRIMQADMIWFSRVNLCDGIAAEYFEKHDNVRQKHDFTEDIRNHAKALSQHYRCAGAHTENMTRLSLAVFDGIQKYAGLEKRDRLLLEIACLLHDSGKYVNMSAGADFSWHIVMATEFVGISQAEKQLIAGIIRYNASEEIPLPADLELDMREAEYIRMLKLAAILRIANVMDRSHRQKIGKVSISVKDKKFVIRADTIYDITLEQSMVAERAGFFESVYGLRPVLRVKKR